LYENFQCRFSQNYRNASYALLPLNGRFMCFQLQFAKKNPLLNYVILRKDGCR